jgi:tetratricopeptide (TPR) repeat protein
MAYFFAETQPIEPDAPRVGTPEEPAGPPSQSPVQHRPRKPQAAPDEGAPVTPAPAARDLGSPTLEMALADLRELAAAQSCEPDPEGLLRTCERTISLARFGGRLREEADASFRAGNARNALAEFGGALDPLQRALDLYRHLGDAHQVTRVEQSLGAALAGVGRAAEAQACFAAAAHSALWDCRWRGRIGLAGLHEQACEFDAALEALAEVLAACDEDGDQAECLTATCYANANLANVYLALGDFAAALEVAQECDRAADALGLGHQRLEALLNAGLALTALGSLGAAAAELDLCRQLAAFAGDGDRALMACSARAWVDAIAGRHGEAARRIEDALVEARRRPPGRATAFCELASARVLERCGDTEGAVAHARAAEMSFGDVGLRHPRAEASVVAARLDPHRPDAIARLDGIAAEAEGLGLRPVEMEARISLAELAGSQAAREPARRAIELARAMEDPDGLARAAVALARWAEPEDEAEAVQAAVDAIAHIRSGLRPEDDAVLEDPMRLMVLRRSLALRTASDPTAARAWLEEVAWPPLEEQGPLGGWGA